MDDLHELYRNEILSKWQEQCSALFSKEVKLSKKAKTKNQLTKEQIDEIKNRQGESISKLAREFGVSVTTICYHQKKATIKQPNSLQTQTIKARNEYARIMFTVADLPEDKPRMQSLMIRTKVRYLTGTYWDQLRKDLELVLSQYNVGLK